MSDNLSKMISYWLDGRGHIKQTREEAVRKYYGLPPFDTHDNVVRNDPYYAAAFKKQHGTTIEKAAKKLGLLP